MSGTIDHCGLKPERYNAIIKLLKQVAVENDVRNLQIELTEGCEKGDGYMGEKHRAALKGDNKTLKVFIKGSSTEESLRNYNDGEIRNYFLIEIVVYDHIYPTFLKFQQDKSIVHPFNNILNILATSNDFNNEILVLPDARELGFTLWDRKKQMNRAHVEIIFKKYGKFHACSYALKNQKPELFNKLVKKLPKDPFSNMIGNVKIGMTDLANKAKEQFNAVEDKQILRRFSEFSDEMMDIMQKTVATDEFSILTHGDCWCNNMLFKYSETSVDHSTPTDICLIDFQLARLGSPVMDLSYFLYSSADASVYVDLEQLLHVYHDSLSEHLTAFGDRADVLFPFSELENQWKQYCNFGLLMAMLLMKIMLTDKENVVDISTVLAESDDILSGFTKESKNDGLYYERLKALLRHFYDNDLFARTEQY